MVLADIWRLSVALFISRRLILFPTSFPQLRYGNKSRMPTQMLAFALSVGLNVRECYDSIYKQLGVKIFSVMLKYSVG